jgi:predicted nucleic acid-binding protein
MPEIVATLNRLRRAGTLSGEEYKALKQRALADMEHATIVPITPEVLASTIESLERAPLRAMDAIHVASALGCSPDRFLTADQRQHAAAQAMGLKSELVG